MRCANKATGEIRDFKCDIKSNMWEAVEEQSPSIILGAEKETKKASTAKKKSTK